MYVVARMVMTEELYYKDAYLKEMRTKVAAVEGKKILTEKTIIFPKASDQPGDTGQMDGIALLGSIKQDEEIWHVLERDPKLKAGDEVLLRLDWKKRTHSMRLHTAAHLLSQLLKKDFSKYDEGLRVDVEGAHLEFTQEVDLLTINKAIGAANQLIANGAAVDTMIEEETKMRLATIGYLRRFNCNGLFVNDAAEIGSISFKKANYKDNKFIVTIEVE